MTGTTWVRHTNWIASHNHYLLTGKEWDEEMELYYFGARYYDAATGVWLTQDVYRGQVEQPLTLHRTLYVLANPVNNVDAYGYRVVANGYGDSGDGSTAVHPRDPTPNPARQDNHHCEWKSERDGSGGGGGRGGRDETEDEQENLSYWLLYSREAWGPDASDVFRTEHTTRSVEGGELPPRLRPGYLESLTDFGFVSLEEGSGLGDWLSNVVDNPDSGLAPIAIEFMTTLNREWDEGYRSGDWYTTEEFYGLAHSITETTLAEQYPDWAGTDPFEEEVTHSTLLMLAALTSNRITVYKDRATEELTVYGQALKERERLGWHNFDEVTGEPLPGSRFELFPTVNTEEGPFQGKDRAMHFFHHAFLASEYVYLKKHNISEELSSIPGSVSKAARDFAAGGHESYPMVMGHTIETMATALLPSLRENAQAEQISQEAYALSGILGYGMEYQSLQDPDNLPIVTGREQIVSGPFDPYFARDIEANRTGAVFGIEQTTGREFSPRREFGGPAMAWYGAKMVLAGDVPLPWSR